MYPLHARPGRLLLAAPCLLGLAGCALSFTNPDPPETAMLESAYEAPTGRVTGAGMSELATAFQAGVEQLDQLGELAAFRELIEVVRSQESGVLPNGSLDEDEGTSGRVLIVAEVKRICEADGADTLPEADRGTIDLTVKGGLHGIYPVIWGQFTRCRERVGDQDVILDGEIFARMRQTERGQATLYSFNGLVEARGRSIPTQIDFRIYDNGTRELRLPGDGGSVIAGLDGNGNQLVRDSVDSWACDFLQQSCQNLVSGEIVATRNVSQ